jgi:hypothetical protein
LTERARREICRRVGQELDSVTAVAREFGVGWACARQAMVDYGDALIEADDGLERTCQLGVDEHTFQHANARRRTQMATTFVDLQRARLLDVVRGRSGQVARDWVESQPIWWVDQIDVAAIDAFGGYATAIGEVPPEPRRRSLVGGFRRAVRAGRRERSRWRALASRVTTSTLRDERRAGRCRTQPCPT